MCEAGQRPDLKAQRIRLTHLMAFINKFRFGPVPPCRQAVDVVDVAHLPVNHHPTVEKIYVRDARAGRIQGITEFFHDLPALQRDDPGAHDSSSAGRRRKDDMESQTPGAEIARSLRAAQGHADDAQERLHRVLGQARAFHGIRRIHVAAPTERLRGLQAGFGLARVAASVKRSRAQGVARRKRDQ